MRCALAILLLFAAALPAAAQRLVRGRVSDGTAPVGCATVVLLRDGRQAAGTTTDQAGRFAVQADTGRYTLTLRHVSYQPLEQPVGAGAVDVELGDLPLRPVGIGEVTVTAETVTREADRFVVHVGDSPAFAGQDGAELLARAPGVWISDNSITINGAGGAKVYVDGRELKGSAEETASFLRSLTAADIARIEVVPLAGAEFAADARGGVILITLRRNRNDGLDGSLQTATTQGGYIANYAPSGRIGIRTGRWTLNASASGAFAPRNDSRFTETRSYNGACVPFSGTSDADGHGNYGRGHIAAIFDPGPRHTVGLDLEYADRSSRIPTLARTVLGETASVSRYRQHGGGKTLTATVNYIWKIDTLGSQFKLIADYTRHTADGENVYRTTIAAPDSARDTLYRSATGSAYDILTADAGLTCKLPHDLTLRTGVRYTRNGMDDQSRYEVCRGQTWQEEPEYGYDQHYTEQTGGVYASLGFAAKRWELSAGVRGEYTSVASQELDRSYFSLFPSFSASYAFNDLRTWMFAAQWSRNIERPSFPALNPARFQVSEYSWQSGNPSLRPTYIQRFSLTAIWRYRYTLTVGGNLHRDLIREIARTDQSDPDIVYIRPENHYTENHWFAAAGIPLKITRWWNLTVNAVGVVQRIRLARTDDPATHCLLFTDATAAFTLPKGFYLEAVYRGQSRLYSGNSEVGPRHTLAATVKKQFCDKRLTFFVTASNLTDCGVEYASETENMRRTLRGRSAWAGRTWKAGAAWNFRSGKRFRARTVESAGEGERRRLMKSEEQSK